VGDKKPKALCMSLSMQKHLEPKLGQLSMGKFMNSKYFPSLSIIDWFHDPLKSSKGSIVWKALVQDFPLVGKWNAWHIGNGEKVRLGEDPWLGAGNNYKLSQPLIKFLKGKKMLLFEQPQHWLPLSKRKRGMEKCKFP
jgi:hypothetical protein